jgi:hypothetical protein
VVVVALHELGHLVARGLPLGLITEDGRPGSPALELGHRGDDRVVLECPAPAAVDVARDEVPPDEIEGRGPAADPDPVTLAERLEKIVIPDGMALVLPDVMVEIDALPRMVETR